MRLPTTIITLILALSWADPASAQYQQGRPVGGSYSGFGQQGGPTVSPYINLLRNNSSTLVNYYGIVRPEVQIGKQVAGISDQQNQNTQAINGLDNVPVTGSAIRFMNTQPYFQSFNRSGGTGAAQGVAGNTITRTGGAINNNSPFGNNGLNGGGGKGSGKNQ